MFLNYLQLGLIVVSIVMMLAQGSIVLSYYWWMQRVPRTKDQEANLDREVLAEPVAVIVCVRGIEEKLKRNLLSILQQEVIKSRLHLVIDSPADSSLPVLTELREEYPDRIQIHELDICNQSAGLKPLGLSQVCRKLLDQNDPPFYFAFSDADTLHPRSWLLRLIGHLESSPKLGAATGQRWYLNVSEQPYGAGTAVRSLWNVASLPQMYFYKVVWGGSWAIDRHTLEKSKLLDAWQRSLFEDTMVASHVKKIGMETSTVPGLFSYSDDQVSLKAAVYWISRQLLDTRLYHPAFPAIAMHGLISALMSLSPLLFLAALAWRSIDGSSVILPLIGLAVVVFYQSINFSIWLLLERVGKHCGAVLQRPVNAERLSLGQRWLTLVVTQYYYPIAAISAMRSQEISWRGIRYRCNSPWKIERLNYQVMSKQESVQSFPTDAAGTVFVNAAETEVAEPDDHSSNS